MTGEGEFRVKADGLNLRTSPEVKPANKVAVLPYGHQVTKLEVAKDPDWWKVSTTISGALVEGFVAHRYLTPADDFEEPPSLTGVAAVHLRENDPRISRDWDGGRAFPLGEPGRPTRTAGNPPSR